MPNFTPAELEVIQVLWEHGSLKPAEIQEKFPRPIKNETLRSALRVLLEKGHVTRRLSGKAYYYEARTPRQGTFKRMSRRLADLFCGGSPAALISQLIQSEKLSPEDIAELQRITALKAEQETGRKAPGKGDDKS
jgi:BlaI family transcriptional regulator, penicillinase repressor